MNMKRLICISFLTSTALAAPAIACEPFDGYFVSTFDSGPGCPGSTLIVPQCTHGRLYQDPAMLLQVATYEFSFDSQDADTTEPGHLDFTGHSVITVLSNGNIVCGQDDGDLYADPGTDRQATFETRVYPFRICPAGTLNACGAVAPAGCKTLTDESHIVATGKLDVITNTASGTYGGQICPRWSHKLRTP